VTLQLLRRSIGSQLHYRAAALVLQPALQEVRRAADYAEYGGAPLLGVNGTVIIAHGRSDARAIKNAIRAADRASRQGVVEEIRAGLRSAPSQGRE
jgi:glycerol-3-phosphate acyltransferase PlsX